MGGQKRQGFGTRPHDKMQILREQNANVEFKNLIPNRWENV